MNPIELLGAPQKLLFAGLALAAAAVGVHLFLSSVRAQGAAECRADVAQATVKAQQVAQAKFDQQQTAITEIASNAAHAIVQAQVGASRAGDALRRLQQRTSDASRVSCDASTAAGGASAPAATDLQSDVLRRIGDAAGQLADYADRARIAGSACESVDAVK